MAISPLEAENHFRNSPTGVKYEGLIDEKLKYGERNFSVVLESGESIYREQISNFVRNLYSQYGWSVIVNIEYERGDYTQGSYTRIDFKFHPDNQIT